MAPNNIKRFMLGIAVVFMIVIFLQLAAGCTQAEKVSNNVSMEADNFNVTRRLVVTNVSMVTSPTVLYELTGNFSINTDNVDGQLEVTCEVHDPTGRKYYTKHFVRLNQYVTYVVEDLSGANVTPYKYELNFMPESIVPVTITTVK